LGCAADSLGARHSHLDERHQGCAQWGEFARRSSGWNDFFHGFRVPLGCRWGRSDASRRRYSRSETHSAAPLANVLWTVYCGRLVLPWAFESSVEVAFSSRTRTTPASSSVQHQLVFDPLRAPTRPVNFLAGASPFYQYIQESRSGGYPKVITFLPNRLSCCEPTATRQPTAHGGNHGRSDSVTIMGVWSDGFSCPRGPLSISQLSNRSASVADNKK